MNKIVRAQDIKRPAVTTGPITGSLKVYSTPEGAGDLRVPLREIALAPSANEPPVRVYDSSGPYTETDAKIDVTTGLARAIAPPGSRNAAASRTMTGRAIKPEDNGNVSGNVGGAGVQGRLQAAARPARQTCHAI